MSLLNIYYYLLNLLFKDYLENIYLIMSCNNLFNIFDILNYQLDDNKNNY